MLPDPYKLFGLVRVAAVDVQDAVAIKKYRGSEIFFLFAWSAVVWSLIGSRQGRILMTGLTVSRLRRRSQSPAAEDPYKTSCQSNDKHVAQKDR